MTAKDADGAEGKARAAAPPVGTAARRVMKRPPADEARHFPAKPGAPPVGALAAAALALLAAKSPNGPDETFSARIEAFCEALTHRDPLRTRLYVSRLIAHGITTEQIYERYVPCAARRLGERWVDDSLSFADVSVGAARLQELTRSLEGRHVEGGATIPLGFSVLIAVPSFEQHSLGAFIAAAQLRKLGLWVQVGVSVSPQELIRLAAGQRFSALGISAASRRSLDPLRNLVEKLRADSDFAGPIALGGAVTDLGEEVCNFTGVDFVTSDTRAFAEVCGQPKGTRLLEYSPTITR